MNKGAIQVIRSNLSAASNAVSEVAAANSELRTDCWDDVQAGKLHKHISDNKKILIEKLEAALEAARGIQ